MSKYLFLVMGIMLVNSFMLTKFGKLYQGISITNKLENSIQVGVITLFISTLTSIFTWLFNKLLLQPLQLDQLCMLVFIATLTAVIYITITIALKINAMTLYRTIRMFLPLIIINCIVVGITLLYTGRQYYFLQFILYSFSVTTGLSITMVFFAAIKERITLADVPAPFKGTSIVFITAGLISLAFMGFIGLIKY